MSCSSSNIYHAPPNIQHSACFYVKAHIANCRSVWEIIYGLQPIVLIYRLVLVDWQNFYLSYGVASESKITR